MGSFLGLVLAGTLLLWLVPGLTTGPRLSLLDALFTATSAVCVTGLTVVDTATAFTPAGQAVLLVLIQVGGIGILTLTTFAILALGGRTSLRTELLVRAQTVRGIRPRDLLRTVVLVTLALEAAGFLLLLARWAPSMGPGPAAWHALFHAVSAFCNAGFSTFSDSLARFRRDPVTLAVVGALVVAGGLGVLPLEELRARRHERRFAHLSLHTKVVLATTAALLLGGTLVFLGLEGTGALRGLGPGHRLANAAFMAVTPRTAGFATVDYAGLSNATLFFTVLLMLVGGSPGGTAGGFKTTTAFVLVAAAWSRWRGRRHVQAFRTTVPEEVVGRAVGLVVGYLFVLGAAVFILMLTELGDVPHALARARLLDYGFEAASAFGTVGLSTGVTPGLSPAGKMTIATLMFTGRVGPMAVAAAMARAARARRRRIRYAEEECIIG